ncbi:ATP-binding protein [Phocaeicola oris]|uniref:ATP-binding protein n=1 Tax=Phocaeicola oris TaxID=2896850 RepID=UPI00234EDC28|nr:ATP-binding protein [Phocaeicola oris]MCE2617309.1 response regulator [Phocaeicola oris]
MLARKELGKQYRESAQFEEAINQHDKALELALIQKDTLEIIQILNQLGTNFRRIGAIDRGAKYHYQALEYCEKYSDKTSKAAEKNRVVSFNGIGNANLTLKNADAAEKAFRQALSGEKKLDSNLGQAINYANIGSILEARGDLDSAYIYYQHSLDYNKKAKSDLGIAICFCHFGELEEKKGNWDKAVENYKISYKIMENSSDRWHWLEACCALARVNLTRNNLIEGKQYLNDGLETAKKINSYGHLASLYRIKSKYEEKNGNIQAALADFQQSMAYENNEINNKNQSSIANMRVNYEKQLRLMEVSHIQQAYENEQRLRKVFLYAGIFIIMAAILTISMLYHTLKMKSRSQKLMRQMEHSRQDFYTNVTHEFRTPLTVILGLGKQIENSSIKDEETLKHTGKMIVRQGNNLLQLINQLLNISKVKSAISNPDWRTDNIVAYTQMIIESYYELAREKHIDLIFIPQKTDIKIDFVPDYTHTILRNLLSNAIKFTPEYGKIIISLEEQHKNFILKVTDTGKGITKEDIPHIFEIFYQSKEYNSSHIGTGIGLSLVDHIVKAMNGTINVESTIGKGSTFIVTLPIKQGKGNWKSYDENKLPLSSLSESDEQTMPKETELGTDLPYILIIEDNADISYYIGSLLKDKYNISYARNGEEGIEKANELIPDLIITDLMMPVKNGYQLCGEIRANEAINHIPIIIITARSTEKDRIKGIEAGADAFLYKPFNPEELTTLITKLLEQRSILRDKYSEAMQNGEEKSVQLSKYDKAFINKFIDMVYAQIKQGDTSSDTLASKLCMSRSQLNRKLLAISGQNTSAYILQIKIGKAKQLLLSNPNLPINEIASRCGFEDVSYFSRIFKQICQVTPTQFRRKV